MCPPVSHRPPSRRHKHNTTQQPDLDDGSRFLLEDVISIGRNLASISRLK
ncbi:unnamed protein product [Protopolystoma xenopodis]|uniref:Uncharacterized protein n=1 Tax=Protopolystoma xenopodis TaxID=117903 RepID=A0A3S5ASC5_9PLAT|nr:unnamed protein product [Protopolystoma xenopodis]